jgi:hypothetical protein
MALPEWVRELVAFTRQRNEELASLPPVKCESREGM